jgi:TRAP-type C4-dicarboxylate transport system permease small subunit
MRAGYARAMDALYVACIVLAGAGLVLITLIIPWGVYTRYVLGHGSAWPEPLSILLMIVFTFLGAAAVYRANAHIAVTLLTDRLPRSLARPSGLVVDLLMALLNAFMVVWGFLLVQATWNQVIAEFPFLSVGITYLPLPVGGLVTLFFIVERVWLGPPPPDSVVYREPAENPD